MSAMSFKAINFILMSRYDIKHQIEFITTNRNEPFFGTWVCALNFNVAKQNWICFLCHLLTLRWCRLMKAFSCAGNAGNFSPPPRDSDQGTCVTHVSWSTQGSLTRGFVSSWWRRKQDNWAFGGNSHLTQTIFLFCLKEKNRFQTFISSMYVKYQRIYLCVWSRAWKVCCSRYSTCVSLLSLDRMCQDYVYVKGEYQSTL